ncbi:MAG TPA: hypothetical protein VOA41_15750 [Candidatus Dormibacteraeota bacterium]|nr:hypothetical protein [Candidatus Dormibacteraeota bacterium]
MLLLSLFLWGKQANAQQKGEPPPAPIIPAKVNRTGQSATVDARATVPGEDEKDEGDAVLQRMQWFYEQRAFPLPGIPAGARMKAFEQMQNMMETEGKLFRTPQGGFAATSIGPAAVPVWQPIGPAPASGGFFSPVSGRITTIAVDPRDPSGDTVLIGGAQGGIWRSTNAGNSWAPETDFAPSLAMGSIAFAPANPNIVYAGTGEQASTGIDVYYGAGILKSTDGGITWSATCPTPGPSCNNPFVGPFGSDFFPGGGARISYLSVNPSNPNLILAGVQIFTGNNSAGVYCSDDGGLNWANILPGQMATFAGYARSTVAFAALGRSSGSTFPGTNPNGIYRSTIADGKGSAGNLPAKCTNITFANLADMPGSGLPSPIGRIDMGIFDANTVYASIADANSNSRTNHGIWVTTNGGSNWTRTNAPDICRSQCWYDNVVKVDPFDPSGRTVFFGGGAVVQNNAFAWVVRATDGMNFSSVIPTANSSDPNRPHVDQHAMAFIKLPDGRVRLYLGNDGGIWRADDAEASTVAWTNINNPGLQLAQFYPSLSVHPSNPSFAFAGTQDNGSLIYSGSANWIDNDHCGDGGWTLIDPVTPSTVYILCQLLSLQKSTTNGAPRSFRIADNGIDPADRLAFIAPMAIDAANPNRLYFGTTKVWQTVDGANSWQATSSGPLAPGAVVVALTVGGNNGSVVYAATSDVRVFVAQNVGPGSVNFTSLSGPLPQRQPTQIIVDPSDPSGNTAYITFSGFSGFGDRMGHIFKTVSAGAPWVDVSCTRVGNCDSPNPTDLPNVPVNDLVIDPDLPGTLYAATDIGVFLSSNGGATWTTLNNNSLPNVAVLSLRMHRASRTLFAATHGRGAWNLSLGGTSTFGITLISPTFAPAGASGVSLTVGGNGFTPNSRIAFAINGNTTIIMPGGTPNPNQLTAVIPGAATASGGNALVMVTDPAQPMATNALTFTVLAPAPTISGVTPNRISVNSPDTPVTVLGTNFNSQSKVIFNPNFSGPGGNSTLATTFSSSSQLSATVPASLMAQFGSTNDVGVMNPPPGGGVTTLPQLLPTFTVVSPPPVNDNFANALQVALVNNSFVDTRDSSAATTEPTDPRPPCSMSIPGNPAPGTTNTVWYKLNDVMGPVTIDTIGSSYDTFLSVWTGSAGALTAVPNACNDDINPGIIVTSRVTFGATAGTTYFILVSSFGLGDPNPVAFGGKSVIHVSALPFPFTLASQPATNTVNAGISATYSISATGQNGFASTITLTCSVQPPAGVVPPAPPSCTFSNASITPGGNPSTSTLTVGTTSRANVPSLPLAPQWPTVPIPWLIALAAPLAMWMYLARTKRQRSLAGVTLSALVFLLIFEAMGCGGGGTNPPPPAHGTTAGQYTLTLTGTSGSLSNSIPVTLNVN